MTDEELIAYLRDSKGWPNLGNAAADRIEQLQADVAGWVSNAYAALEYQREAEYKLEAAEAKLTKAVEVLREYAPETTDGVEYSGMDDAGRKARAVLDELEK